MSGTVQDVINFAVDAESFFAMKEDLAWLEAHKKGDTPEAQALREVIAKKAPELGSLDAPLSAVADVVETRARAMGYEPPKKFLDGLRSVIGNTPDLTQTLSRAASFKDAAVAVAKSVLFPALAKAGQYQDALKLMTVTTQVADEESLVMPTHYTRKHGI